MQMMKEIVRSFVQEQMMLFMRMNDAGRTGVRRQRESKFDEKDEWKRRESHEESSLSLND